MPSMTPLLLVVLQPLFSPSPDNNIMNKSCAESIAFSSYTAIFPDLKSLKTYDLSVYPTEDSSGLAPHPHRRIPGSGTSHNTTNKHIEIIILAPIGHVQTTLPIQNYLPIPTNLERLRPYSHRHIRCHNASGDINLDRRVGPACHCQCSRTTQHCRYKDTH